MSAVVGAEEEVLAGQHDPGWVGAAERQIDDPRRACWRSVAAPELITTYTVACGEEQRTMHIGHPGCISALHTWCQVDDLPGAGRCAVAGPQLPATHTIIGTEE